MKKVLDGLISRLDMAEERISELEDISIEFTKSKQTKLKSFGTHCSLSPLGYTPSFSLLSYLRGREGTPPLQS